MTDVLVVAELLEGGLRKNTLSAVTFAKQVAEGTGGAFDILAIGEGAQAAADQAAGYGARKVLVAEIEGGYFAEKYAPTVAAVGKGYGVVVATASTYGKDLLPRVAARLDAGVASDIAGVSLSCLLAPPIWFSTKYSGLVILPTSWYIAPTYASRGSASIASAAASQIAATLSECVYVPGARC